MMNDWFDLMNTRTKERKNVCSSSYGMFLDEQNQFLEDVGSFTRNTRCLGKASLQVIRVFEYPMNSLFLCFKNLIYFIINKCPRFVIIPKKGIFVNFLVSSEGD